MMSVVASLAFATLLVASGTATAQPAAKPEAAKEAPAKPDAAKEAPAKPAAAKPAAKVIAPKRFASAEEALDALVAAMRKHDTKAMVAILGSAAQPLVSSGDPVVDKQNRERFVQAYDAAHKLVPSGDTVIIHAGADDWPMPIPIVKDGSGWRFDVQKGREEVLARSVGRNELYTIQTCLAYVDAQREYYAVDRNGDGILEYAQKFASSPGKKDGLYWPTSASEKPSPLGEFVVRARAEGYRRKSDGPTPYHGYVYRILTAQGPAAPDGAYNYMVKGHLVGGFALVAFPAQYGVSGVMTFIVSHDGVVFQKDLGPKTRATALEMTTFDPDSSWTKVDASDLNAGTGSAQR